VKSKHAGAQTTIPTSKHQERRPTIPRSKQNTTPTSVPWKCTEPWVAESVRAINAMKSAQ